MDSPSPPPAPDPVKTANAQATENVTAGVTNQMNNMVDQYTPQGSLTYSQTGTRHYDTVDPKGKPLHYDIPSWAATQSYSPAEQALFDTSNQTKQQISQIGLDQSKKMGDLLNTPINLDDTSIDNHLHDLYAPRVQQQQGRESEMLDAKLANQGITAGSEAYNNEHTLEGNRQNDQWNQLYLQGHQSAIQQMTQQRQEPINELDALLKQGQVSNPTYGQTPSSTIAAPNYEQDVYNTYNAQMQAYNAQQQSQNAMMGGIFGTIGSLAGGWAASDRRLKRDIERIGTLQNGLPLYSFHYVWGGPRQIGLMADEVERLHPNAVMSVAGFALVNYDEAVH